MTTKLSIALAQLNFTVGDIDNNRKKILKAHKKANAQGADLIVFSEMSVTGYPPEDLVLRPSFQEAAIAAVRNLATHTKNGTAMLVGGLWREGEQVYNAAFLLDDGQIQHIVCKYDLPNYGVFDEKRLFSQGPTPQPVEFRGHSFGVMICEDMWNLQTSALLAKQGAKLMIVLNGSPFESQKQQLRQELALENVRKAKRPLIYVNQVGGQDELVFEGGSFVYDAHGDLLARLPQWQEDIVITHWKLMKNLWMCAEGDVAPQPAPYEAIYRATTLGLSDYVEKNGFPGVVIGMSGGIDSALTAAIAVDALGPKRVHTVMMPSQYTSNESIEDAEACVKLLKIKMHTIPIHPAVAAFSMMLAESFEGTKPDVTEENLQSRIRGNLLMALSNKHGNMVLTTGNKSEMAVGYATLYGDMCGGFNVLKDLYKTEIYELARWRNAQSKVIPDNILTKAPTAELRPNQTDQDSLPPYDVLDSILFKLIERQMSSKEVAQSGFPLELVEKVAQLLKMSEYKRRQAPPGVKVTGLAFGRDRRYPITNRFAF